MNRCNVSGVFVLWCGRQCAALDGLPAGISSMHFFVPLARFFPAAAALPAFTFADERRRYGMNKQNRAAAIKQAL